MDAAREALAKYILEAALLGERDRSEIPRFRIAAFAGSLAINKAILFASCGDRCVNYDKEHAA